MFFRIYSILERLNRNADKNGDFFTVLREENGNLNAGAENKGKRIRVHSDNAGVDCGRLSQNESGDF